ncbi:MAG: hypothetical protein LBC56_08675 [Oscillospiraceae bacterium]|jgi:hypothetical protein|nr:hypothetical protein [Oscillospiraceae bacterium]
MKNPSAVKNFLKVSPFFLLLFLFAFALGYLFTRPEKIAPRRYVSVFSDEKMRL